MRVVLAAVASLTACDAFTPTSSRLAVARPTARSSASLELRRRLALQHMVMTVGRRTVLPLPLLLFSLPALSADKFDYVENGQVKQLTEIESRDRLTKKVEAATAAGKGLDLERRGQFNEKSLFSEDFYFKYGLRPTPQEALNSPYVPPQGELPFAPVQRRYTGYSKYKERIIAGIAAYGGELRDAIADGKWAEIGPMLEKGSKGKGNGNDGGGSGVPPSELRSSCRALGLFANTVLQSENDSGTTAANLLTRHLVNEFYFSLDDIADAAQSGDKTAAALAWSRGKDYLNAYVRIVNFPISAKVGDKFPLVTANDATSPPAPPSPPPPAADGPSASPAVDAM